MSATSDKHAVDTAKIHTCNLCSGVWLGGASLKIMFSTVPNGPNFEMLLKNSELKQKLSEDRLCPKCKDTNLFILKIRSVEIDFCGNCDGVFFDAGELQTLIPKHEKDGHKYKAGSILAQETILNILPWLFTGP